jgi:hypothetical protein
VRGEAGEFLTELTEFLDGINGIFLGEAREGIARRRRGGRRVFDGINGISGRN